MLIEEFEKDLESFLYSLFSIEKDNLPRSSFSGIKSQKEKVKRSNRLKNNGFQFTKRGNEYIFKIDLSRIPYAEWINDNPKYATYQYWQRVCMDIIYRISDRYNGNITE